MSETQSLRSFKSAVENIVVPVGFKLSGVAMVQGPEGDVYFSASVFPEIVSHPGPVTPRLILNYNAQFKHLTLPGFKFLTAEVLSFMSEYRKAVAAKLGHAEIPQDKIEWRLQLRYAQE